MRAARQPRAGVLSYGRQSVAPEDLGAVAAALASAHLTQGPLVPRFEDELARLCGARHAVVVANGTCALHGALLALGIGPGKRVLTSANTFLASATSALHCGAEVDFLDIDAETMNLDAAELGLRLAAGERVDAVVAVHFAGRPCPMAELLALKRLFGFALVEDACHALGATWTEGGRAWRVGEHPEVDAAVLSFHPVKHITTGEGGAVLTNAAGLAARVRRLRSHGIDPDGEHLPWPESSERPAWFAPMAELGFNWRMTELQAALGLSQLARLSAFLERRAELARHYAKVLPAEVERPEPGSRAWSHAWHLYVARVDPARRDRTMWLLRARGIHTQLHYYPVPLQPYFRERARAHGHATQSYAQAERHARSAISLPLHPGLDETDVERVARELGAALGR